MINKKKLFNAGKWQAKESCEGILIVYALSHAPWQKQNYLKNKNKIKKTSNDLIAEVCPCIKS